MDERSDKFYTCSLLESIDHVHSLSGSKAAGACTTRRQWLPLVLLLIGATGGMFVSLLFMASRDRPAMMMGTLSTMFDVLSPHLLMVGARILGALSVALGGTFVGLAYFIVNMLIRPKRVDAFIPLTSFSLDLPAEEVTFAPCQGDYLVRGIYSARQDATTTILLSPGYHRSSTDVLSMCKHLWMAGHNVLAFEYYGHGAIVGVPVTLGYREVNDFLGAVAYAKRRAPEARIGAMGYAMGGAITIIGSTHTSDVLAIVADSAFASPWNVIETAIRRIFHLPINCGTNLMMKILSWITDCIFARRVGCHFHQVEPWREIARLAPRPIFLIHGLNDTVVPPADSVHLYEAACAPKMLWQLPGVDHMKGYATDSKRYIDRIITFFDSSLKQPISPLQKYDTDQDEEGNLFIPNSRLAVLLYEQNDRFAFASSLEKASLLPIAHEYEQINRSYETPASPETVITNLSRPTEGVSVEDVPENEETGEERSQRVTSPKQPLHATTLRAKHSLLIPVRGFHKHIPSQRSLLVATVAVFLIVAGAVLLPALFSMQPRFRTAISPGSTSVIVGQITFTSSGQFNASNSQGLNDVITVDLSHLTSTGVGQSDYGWLLPDSGDDTTKPLLLGRLSIVNGRVRMIYTCPDHENLLAMYSGFEVTEQPENEVPVTPSLDPKALRALGRIPHIPTPGDEQHYSLLDHMRHLLAADPTLQHIGLQGGLNIWLYRNTEKVLEWSSAAQDNWAGGQQTALIHRQMLRILDTLDGSVYVSLSGDVPPGSPLLVDPLASRVGIVQMSPTQVLPAYLTHIDLHLQGLMNAPGHSQAQRQLAIKIDAALKIDTQFLQNVHHDAIKLAKMNETQLKGTYALSLLNDLVSNANSAYTGQFDSALGATINGVAWIHDELQGIATIPVMTVPENHESGGDSSMV